MKKIDALNLVPFIDIMLVLLVIVLTTASFITTSRMPISVPQVDQSASKNHQEIKKEQVHVTIDKKGEYFIENQKKDLAQLKTLMASYPKDTPIILHGDKQSNLDSFIQIFDILQNLNLKEVYVVVEEKKPF